MEVKGQVWELEALLREVMKDRSYFGTDGGVTFSGGEALMQVDFVIAAVKRLKEAGIHTAIDTAGLVPEATMRAVWENVDLILYDLKIFDRGLHERFTAMPNDRILENARLTAQYHREHGSPEIWIRTPIIPGATDNEENITAIGQFIAAHMDDVFARWELCSFNNLCASKYARLGQKWPFENTPLLRKGEMEFLTEVAKKSGADSGKILWTGATRVESV
jgi:pyruvate formate lyase activating enzyme